MTSLFKGSVWGIFFSVILILPGCVTQQHIKPLQPLLRKNADNEQTRNGVTVRTKQLAKQEISEALGGRQMKLASGNKRGVHRATIVPVQVHVENNSSDIIVLNRKSITPSPLSAKEVHALANRGRTQINIAMGVGLLVASAVILPLSLLGYALASLPVATGMVSLPTAVVCGGMGVGSIGGLGWGCYSIKDGIDNSRVVKRGLACIAPNGDITLDPKKSIDFLLFYKLIGQKRKIDVKLSFSVANNSASRHLFTVPVVAE